MNTQATLPLSIIIPAYSEEKLLPYLLESISKQYFQPLEVIVADAFSKDKTRDIAKSFGAKVVDGGKISVGRNAGAKVARGEYLLFLDADTILEKPTTLGDAFLEFLKAEVDIASAKFNVSVAEQSFFAKTVLSPLYESVNIVRSIQSGIFSYPQWEGGAFILLKKSTFEHVGGFDENLTVGEDRAFFQNAVKLGYKYKCLNVYLATSTRRYNTPKKVASQMVWVVFETVAVGVGLYAGSMLFKKLGKKLYGRLGGGEGKDPTE